MLTMLPFTACLIINLAASCIRKNGARTLIANMRSNNSGLVLSRFPRSVRPAAFTRISTRPYLASACAKTARQWSTFCRSATTKVTGTPVSAVIAWATASPLSRSRPQVMMPAAPAWAKSLATAAPRPWVPPVTTAIFPSIRFTSDSDPLLAADFELLGARLLHGITLGDLWHADIPVGISGHPSKGIGDDGEHGGAVGLLRPFHGGLEIGEAFATAS